MAALMSLSWIVHSHLHSYMPQAFNSSHLETATSTFALIHIWTEIWVVNQKQPHASSSWVIYNVHSRRVRSTHVYSANTWEILHLRIPLGLGCGYSSVTCLNFLINGPPMHELMIFRFYTFPGEERNIAQQCSWCRIYEVFHVSCASMRNGCPKRAFTDLSFARSSWVNKIIVRKKPKYEWYIFYAPRDKHSNVTILLKIVDGTCWHVAGCCGDHTIDPGTKEPPCGKAKWSLGCSKCVIDW